MAARTVRDREAEGSNPSPPTIFVFKATISGVLKNRRVTDGAHFAGEPSFLPRAAVTVVVRSELGCSQSMVLQGLALKTQPSGP